MSICQPSRLICPQCQNNVHFIELNISGYVANFETKPSITFNDVSHYARVGIICADCFSRGDYVLVANEGELLPTHIIEKALANSQKAHIKLVQRS